MHKQKNKLNFQDVKYETFNSKAKPFGYYDGENSLTFKEKLAKQRKERIENFNLSSENKSHCCA